MTTVSSATSTGTTTSSTTSTLSANFETFLTLLTAQLKNQDPLSPMDTSEFTSQLVQYSEVEQSMETNSLLENLNTLTAANSGSYAVSYLGNVGTTSDTTATLSDGEASWNYTIPTEAAEVTLKIYDSSGTLVQTLDGTTTKGTHELVWDGTKSSGTQLTSGEYTLEVSAVNSSGSTLDTTVSRTGTITAVDMSGDEPTVQIGGTYVLLSTITNLAKSTT